MTHPRGRGAGSEKGTTQSQHLSYRLKHPVRYSAAAAVVAAVIAGPLDLLLLGDPWQHAWKFALTSAITWFGVLVVLSFSVRLEVTDRV